MLTFVRIWLPAVVTLAGVLVIVIGRDEIALEGGAGIIGAGLAIWLMNVLFRVGLHDDRDRDAEDAARDFFDAHGHWPDEAPPTGNPPRSEPATPPRRPSRSRGQLPPRRPG